MAERVLTMVLQVVGTFAALCLLAWWVVAMLTAFDK